MAKDKSKCSSGKLTRRQVLKWGGLGTAFLILDGVVGPSLFDREGLSLAAGSPASGYQLPSWFLGNRVHAHTRLTLKFMDLPVFFHAGSEFKKMGARVFVRHIKSGDEGAWWPSAVGAVVEQAKKRNIAREIIDEAHGAGCKIIVYHRHMEDRYMAEKNPDWVCVNWRGMPLRSRRGEYMCFNSPYPDYFLTRLNELAEMGADGFYFDEVHMPKTGCWCKYCKKKFKSETGLDHPRKVDPRDPLWNKLVDFNNLTIERTFQKWRSALHSRNSQIVMVVSSHSWPAMIGRHLTNRLFRIADSVKTEFKAPLRTAKRRNLSDLAIFSIDDGKSPFEDDVKLALGFSLCRDAADGRPAHVWTPGLVDEASSLYATAGILTHGCIANLDVKEHTIPNEMFKAAFNLGNKVSPFFSDARPCRWVAIHYSEMLRDQYLAQPAEAVKKVIYPVCGAFSTLLRERLPAGLITDSQLEEGLLAGYKALFIPGRKGLSNKMSSEVEKFKASGGIVVENRTEWEWQDPVRRSRASGELLQQLASVLPGAMVQVAGGPLRMHATAYTTGVQGRLIVSVCNDFSWVYAGREKPDRIPSPPVPCTGAKCILYAKNNPKKAHDVVSGKELPVKREGGRVIIDIPTFDYMAVLVIDQN